MKKSSKILTLLISMLSISNIYAAIDRTATTIEKMGFWAYIVLTVIIFASVATFFHFRIRRIKEFKSEDRKVIISFRRKTILIRILFILIIYLIFLVFLITGLFAIMYSVEGLGKSTTEIVIYSPMSAATKHFLETVLMSGLVVAVTKIGNEILKAIVKIIDDYNEEEKKVLLEYYK